MREAAKQNCQTLTQSHLTPVNAPTASHARCRSPHCILAARDLKTGACFLAWVFSLKCPGTLSSCNKYTVKSALQTDKKKCTRGPADCLK
jgi:hypothetical protein